MPPNRPLTGAERKSYARPAELQESRTLPPLFHFVILPLLLLNIIFSIYYTIRHWPAHWALDIWWIVMSILLFLLAGTAAAPPSRLRTASSASKSASVSPPFFLRPSAAQIDQLTPSQLIALRFASDEELPILARKALDQNLEQKAIKQSIVNWRADYDASV